MPAWNRDKLFARRFHGLDVLASEGRRSRKILLALKDKHRKGKFQAKLSGAQGFGLRHEPFSAQHLAIAIVVDILHRTASRNERKPKRPVQELVSALELIRPLALHAAA